MMRIEYSEASADVFLFFDPSFTIESAALVKQRLTHSHHSYIASATFPIPSTKLSFHALVYVVSARVSRPNLDSVKRKFHSILTLSNDRAAHVPVLVLLQDYTSDSDSIDSDDLCLALDLDAVLPEHDHQLLTFRQSDSETVIDSGIQWLKELLHSQRSHTDRVWCHDLPILPVLTDYVSKDVSQLVLSFLTSTKRGGWMKHSDYYEHRLALEQHERQQENQIRIKEFLRFVSAYDSHHLNRGTDCDDNFVEAFTHRPQSLLFPNSSYFHLDILRFTWLSMKARGIVSGSRQSLVQLITNMTMNDRCRSLLRHWSHSANDNELFNLTQWCCVVQCFVDLCVAAHYDHPQHHQRSLTNSPPLQPAAPSNAGDRDKENRCTINGTAIRITNHSPTPMKQSPPVDTLPVCFPTFRSFLHCHPQLLTLAFVEDYYSPSLLGDLRAWRDLLPSNRAPLQYWLPYLQKDTLAGLWSVS